MAASSTTMAFAVVWCIPLILLSMTTASSIRKAITEVAACGNSDCALSKAVRARGESNASNGWNCNLSVKGGIAHGFSAQFSEVDSEVA
jgi:hypothetical protein